MAYRLTGITIRANNSVDGMNKIKEIWCDITSGKLPILFDSEHDFQQGIFPISMYSNYATDETGDYDLSVLGVSSDFFKQMEVQVSKGLYKKYDVADNGGNIEICTKAAWKEVWEEQAAGQIKRAFTKDYESSVPAEYTKDNKVHCFLYIAVE